MKRLLPAPSIRAMMLLSLGGAAVPALVLAQEADPNEDPKLETVIVEGQVNDQLDILPTEPVDSVFGFGKTLLETPRSITTISNELLNRFNISELDDMVALSPGSFTQSFFGVAGSLDVRGTPGEVYFRGVRRIDNPGNYPTPIGASDRVDVVRGPASPIYGPSKIGGYLNFVPKSARAETGQWMEEARGELSMTRGSWDKDILTAEVGGPGTLFGKKFGYYVYSEVEDSGSYYENSSTEQAIYQGSFNMDLTDSSRIEFGGMYQEYEGNQVAGWNRVTQELIDHGTYITGTPNSLDTNGDGYLAGTEVDLDSEAGLFAWFDQAAGAVFGLTDDFALQDPGTTHIEGSTVLVQEDDELTDDVLTLYFDFIHEFDNGLTMTNKSFYESLVNTNLNAYGFSQFADTWVFEDQLIFALSTSHGDWVKGSYQFSPSFRYQDFEHGDNFDYEYFDRRDITQPGSPVDRRTLSVRDGAEIEKYSSHHKGSYSVLGLSFLVDYSFFDRVHFLGGIRQDMIDIESTCGFMLASGDYDSNGCGSDLAENDITGVKQSGDYDATSWSASLSFDVVKGLTPYVTLARQSTMVVGQGGEVPAENVAQGSAVADSKLNEYGVKASLLDGRIYTTLAYYDQERVDFNAQNTVTNNTTQAKGWEFEFRGVFTDNWSVTGAWSKTEVFNLTAKQQGGQFSFAGAEDLPDGVEPYEIFGGTVGTFVPTTDGRKAGVPENIYSVYLIYTGTEGLLSGLTASLGATMVDEAPSGFSQSITLPDYTLINAGINYETKHWKVGISGKNLTDERYFRSNFPDLFGSSVVLPELPRNYLVTLGYKF